MSQLLEQKRRHMSGLMVTLRQAALHPCNAKTPELCAQPRHVPENRMGRSLDLRARTKGPLRVRNAPSGLRLPAGKSSYDHMAGSCQFRTIPGRSPRRYDSRSALRSATPRRRKGSALSHALPMLVDRNGLHRVRLLSLVLSYQLVNLTLDGFKVEGGRSLHRWIFDCS